MATSLIGSIKRVRHDTRFLPLRVALQQGKDNLQHANMETIKITLASTIKTHYHQL